MSDKTIICEHCGALCHLKDGFCKSCWKKIPVVEEQEELIIEGIGQAEWETFIDKNTDHYIDAYKKHEGKKFFLNINWAAFFFGVNWLLYRKMYKFAIIGYIILTFFTLVLSTAYLLPHKEEIQDLTAKIQAHEESQMMSSGMPTITADVMLAEKRIFELKLNATLISLCLIPVQFVVYGFIGDALYKMHIKKNLGVKKGGASVSSLIGGRFILSTTDALIISPAVSLIISMITNL